MERWVGKREENVGWTKGNFGQSLGESVPPLKK